MTTSLSNLSFTGTSNASWNASVNEPAFTNPLSNVNSLSKKITLGNSVTNTTAGGADELYASLLTPAASGAVTLTLSSLVDACGQTGLSFARVKYLRVHLLSVADDSVNGTAASSITVGNAASHSCAMFLGGTTQTFTVNNGGVIAYGDPGGTGIAITSGNNDQ